MTSFFLSLLFPLLKVKVDESLSLDHVTRDRVKMTHSRRPPTRSHLKEVSAPPWGEPSAQLRSPRAAPSTYVPNPGKTPGTESPEKADMGNSFFWVRLCQQLMKLQVPIDL